jgi:hypothetical protein
MASVKLPLSKLESWNPFRNVIWGMDLEQPITRKEVEEAIASEDFKVDPDWGPSLEDGVTRRDHIARVAYLVVHGWGDAIEFEANPYGDWPIYDGNHRLAAAFFRGDTEIDTEVGGFLSYAADLLGIPEGELSQGF